MHFEIEFDKAAGYYLRVWKNGIGIRDDLQDTLEWAKAVALEEYQVPTTTWKQTEDNT